MFNKRLMKWREPKIKGLVTRKNILTALISIFIIAIPFGFIGGNGRFFSSGHFSVSTYGLGLGFLSIAVLCLAMQPLLPGILIQLKDDMVVRGPRGDSNDRTLYRDIERIYFYRGCHYSRHMGINFVRKKGKGPSFTYFDLNLRTESSRSVKYFSVPDDVNLEQVLQILREKGVNVIEAPLPS